MSMNTKLAQQIYETLQSILTDLKITFEKDTDATRLHFDYSSEDMRHRMYVDIDQDSSVVKVLVVLPFDVSSGKKQEMMEAICRINEVLTVGFFSYDLEETVMFQLSELFLNSILSRELLESMILRTVHIVEDFDDRLTAINKGYLKPEDILQGLG